MPSLAERVKDVMAAVETVQATLTLEDRMKLRSELLCVQDDAMRLQEENMRLRRENENLRRELALRKRLECVDGLYYAIGDDGETIGPLCPDCYTGKGIINLLEETGGAGTDARCARGHTRATRPRTCRRCSDRPASAGFSFAGTYAPQWGHSPGGSRKRDRNPCRRGSRPVRDTSARAAVYGRGNPAIRL